MPQDSGRSGSSGSKGSRGNSKSSSSQPRTPSHPLQDAPPDVSANKKRYHSQLLTLQEVYPKWSIDDLLSELLENNADLDLTISKIAEGRTNEWESVESRKTDKKKTPGSLEPSLDASKPHNPRAPRSDGAGSGERSNRTRSNGGNTGRGEARPSRAKESTTSGAVTASLTSSAWDDALKADWTDTTSLPASTGADLATSSSTSAPVVAPPTSQPTNGPRPASQTISNGQKHGQHLQNGTNVKASPPNSKLNPTATKSTASSAKTSIVTPGMSWSSVASAGNAAAKAAEHPPKVEETIQPEPTKSLQPPSHHSSPVLKDSLSPAPLQTETVSISQPANIDLFASSDTSVVAMSSVTDPRVNFAPRTATSGPRPRPMVPSAASALAAAHQAAVLQAAAATITSEPMVPLSSQTDALAGVPIAVGVLSSSSAVARPSGPSGRAVERPRGLSEDPDSGVVMPSTAFDTHLDVSFGSINIGANASEETDASLLVGGAPSGLQFGGSPTGVPGMVHGKTATTGPMAAMPLSAGMGAMGSITGTANKNDRLTGAYGLPTNAPPFNPSLNHYATYEQDMRSGHYEKYQAGDVHMGVPPMPGTVPGSGMPGGAPSMQYPQYNFYPSFPYGYYNPQYQQFKGYPFQPGANPQGNLPPPPKSNMQLPLPDFNNMPYNNPNMSYGPNYAQPPIQNGNRSGPYGQQPPQGQRGGHKDRVPSSGAQEGGIHSYKSYERGQQQHYNGPPLTGGQPHLPPQQQQGFPYQGGRQFNNSWH